MMLDDVFADIINGFVFLGEEKMKGEKRKCPVSRSLPFLIVRYPLYFDFSFNLVNALAREA